MRGTKNKVIGWLCRGKALFLHSKTSQHMKSDLRIIYMGTPDFAVPALNRLLAENYNVVGVVTTPDRAIGRHHEALQACPVKKFAEAHGLPVLQPERLKDESFLADLRALKADLQVVVAFRMLPEAVWDMPRLGTFNLHAALLPQYRGAAPINWAVINGESETGLTTFFLDHQIDTGRIILQERVPIGETDTAGDVHDRLMMLGADLVQRTVDLITQGQATSTPQEQFLTDAPLHPAPKIFHETCQIHWNSLTTRKAYDFIRGLSPYPAAWTTLRMPTGIASTIKIFHTSYHLQTQTLPAGTLITDGKSDLRVILPDGYLSIMELQLAGKKRMSVADFLRGTHIEGAHFTD